MQKPLITMENVRNYLQEIFEKALTVVNQRLINQGALLEEEVTLGGGEFTTLGQDFSVWIKIVPKEKNRAVDPPDLEGE